MSAKTETILHEYYESKDIYEETGVIAKRIIDSALEETGLRISSVGYRLKTERSLRGKLDRKGDKYSSISDITDILGIRIVTVFADDVDVVSQLIKDHFRIDWENSVDKRNTMNVREFGYLSLHYICALPEDENYPASVKGIWFEIQVRSAMQHIWSEINHDIGYKSDFALPRSCMRSFSKLASLLEIADEIACNLRNDIDRYVAEVRDKIAGNCANDIEIDRISINEYVKRNSRMKEFFKQLTKECGIEVSFEQFDTENFTRQLNWFGYTKLGDLQDMYDRDHDISLRYAHERFDGLGIDIISCSVGLRIMLTAELISRNYSYEQIVDFYNISIEDRTRAERRAKALIDFKNRLFFPDSSFEKSETI